MHGATDTPIQRSRLRACTRAHTSGCPGYPGTGRHLCNGASCASAVAMHLRHPGLLQLAGTSSPCRVYRRAIPYPPCLPATVKRIPLCPLILNRYSRPPKRAVPCHWLTPESERLLVVNELPRERQHAKNSDRAARPLSTRSILTNSRFVSVREFAWGNRYSRCGKSWVRATRAPSHLRTSRSEFLPLTSLGTFEVKRLCISTFVHYLFVLSRSIARWESLKYLTRFGGIIADESHASIALRSRTLTERELRRCDR